MIRSIKLGLAGLAFAAFASLFLPASAQAADYNGNCAGAPTSISGNATITDTACTISHAVTATGFISITANTVSTQALTTSGAGAAITIAGTSTITGTSLSAKGAVNVNTTAGQVTYLSTVKSTGGGAVTVNGGSVTTGAISTTTSPISIAGTCQEL